MARFYLAYKHHGRFAGAVLAHAPMFCRIVARMAGLKEVEHARELVPIDYEDGRRVPPDMFCRVLGEREVRKLMAIMAPKKPSRR